jgi:hypothetical protein
MALATLRIDSLRNNLDQYGSARNTLIVYSVLSIAPFDTSIYTNAEEMFPQSGDKWIDTNVIRYDTMGFPRYFVDSMGVQNRGFSIGDTLRNIFILQSDCSDSLAFWTISYTQDTSFLHESNPPFPLQQALRFYNLYLNQNSMYKGFRPPKNGIIKLGPVFDLAHNNGDGQPGWMLRAYNDTDYWYFKHATSGGDCMLGCGTEWAEETYKISSDGTIQLLGCQGIECPPALIVYDKQQKFEKTNAISTAIYDLSGRKIGIFSLTPHGNYQKTNADLKLKPGLYILRTVGHSNQHLIHIIQ